MTLAATTVVATAVVGDSVAAIVITVAANQNDDYKDNNPCAIITAIE